MCARCASDRCCRGSTRFASPRTASSSSTCARCARTPRSTTAGCARAARSRRRSRRARARSARAGRSSSAFRTATRSPSCPEPVLRRLTDSEAALVEAADLFNASLFRRTIEGVARALGAPLISIVPLSGVNSELVLDLRLGDHLVPVPRASRGRAADPARRPRSRHRPRSRPRSPSGTRHSETTAASSRTSLARGARRARRRPRPDRTRTAQARLRTRCAHRRRRRRSRSGQAANASLTGVVHGVDEHGHRQPEPSHTRARRGEPLVERRVLRDENVFVEVGLELPAVRRVRLGDVDEHDVGATSVALVEGLDVAGPATKGRSGEAAEDEDERSLAGERLQRHSDSPFSSANKLELRYRSRRRAACPASESERPSRRRSSRSATIQGAPHTPHRADRGADAVLGHRLWTSWR